MFLNGISIVLSGNRESFEGAAIAWATKIEKNHVLVSLPLGSAITDFVKTSKIFSVSVLGEHQSDIVRQYGGSKQAHPLVRNPDDLDFEVWPVPVVKDCRASMLCKNEKEITLEEQYVVIARIEHSNFLEATLPLVYEHARYFS